MFHSPAETGLLVYLAQFLFCFRYQLLKAAFGQIVHGLPLKLAVLHNLHFEFHALVFMRHATHQKL